MIDLGKSKEVTDVLKLKTQFSPKMYFSQFSLFLSLSLKVPLLLHLMQIYGIFVLVFFVFPKHKATHSYFLVYFLGDREK